MIYTDSIVSPCRVPLQLFSGSDEIILNDHAILAGSATCFDDWTFPFSQVKIGSNLKPDFSETNVGLLFPQNNAAEKIFMIGQAPHCRKVGTDIEPHLHYTQTAATAVTFKLDYKWYNLGEAEPADWTTITSTTNVFPYVSGTISQILNFPVISGVGMGISSIMKCKLYREDNTTTGDVLADQFDFHIEIDGFGSATQLVK